VESLRSQLGVARKIRDVTAERGLVDALSWTLGRVLDRAVASRNLIRAQLHSIRGLSDRAFIRRFDLRWRAGHDLIVRLKTRETQAFPLGSKCVNEFLLGLEKAYPDIRRRAVQGAEAILEHRFRVLGQEFVFPGEVNWHYDHSTGGSWPKQFIGQMDRWFWNETRDPLPVWELNRHQFFSTLGRAYWLTGDERYAEEFVSQVGSWIKQNPCEFGVNWIAVLETGVRLVSWSIAFFFFRASKAFTASFATDFLKSLYQQAHYLRNHLTTDRPVQNNWMICQAASLAVVGSLFPELPESEEWLHLGLAALATESSLQISPDGVNREQAVGYHRFVLDLLLLIVVLGRRGALEVPHAVDEAVERMMEYALLSMNPVGHLSRFGDTDEGWGIRFGDNTDYWDLRPWLAVGAVLYDRADFKFGAKKFCEDSYWMLGESGLVDFRNMEQMPPRESGHAFKEGGHHVIRDDWGPRSDFLIMRCGEFGLGGEGACAHAHNDLLSLILWVGGNLVLVDSGTYCYHGPWRNHFRLTSAHNTLRIDGRDQAVPAHDFSWRDIPAARSEYHDERTIIGLLPNLHGVSIRREVAHPTRGLWRVTDEVVGSGSHSIEAFFHFAPDLSLGWNQAHDHLIVRKSGYVELIIVPPKNMVVEIGSGWYSDRYGTKEQNPLLTGTWIGDTSIGGVKFIWTLRASDLSGQAGIPAAPPANRVRRKQ